ncbi:sulfotransferase family protein [Colwellia marinimaniae]|uniref:Sulfotransferase family protein n=2 Tax=Colwelliaceae TaxID=267889 RepID=A0ABQ0MXJ7_9GAMM|nr:MULTISPECIES: sulfotransferase [Colwellia]GAW97107.1 sulfotransferase family protein [Colwellia marinimaniae]
MFDGKIFIIGLPRTATTSVCLAMLEQGFKTAHNVYTQNAFVEAQVLADTPIFCDYQKLDKHFPNSKFIYLTRSPEQWLPSIKQLLQRMIVNLQRTDGGFNPHLKRCYNEVFAPLTANNINSDEFFLSCYSRHQQGIDDYFKDRSQDLLTIDVSDKNSYMKMLAFVNIDSDKAREGGFKKINLGGKVKAWQGLNNTLKVESTNKGKIDKLLY